MSSRWKKGQSGNPSGRPKGTLDKFTDLKTSFLNVYKRLGGDDAFLEWAQADPRNLAAFYIMLKSMLPKEVTAEVRSDIQISWAAPEPQPQIIDAEVITPLDTPPPANPDKVSDNG